MYANLDKVGSRRSKGLYDLSDGCQPLNIHS